MTTTPVIHPVTVDFDSSNQNWSHEKSYTDLFLRASENYVNSLLDVNGFVVLNEVLDQLGIPRSADGINSGWVKSHGRINFRTDHQPDKITLTFYVQDNISEAVKD